MEKLSFDTIGLSSELLKAINEMGFEEASPIQAEAIPELLQGKDIIGQAQTGTGKTAAFGIPILETIDLNSNHVQSIVLCPTRELSIQVAKEIGALGKYKKGLVVLPIYGGQPIDRQIKSLKKGVHIVIGTPGRVIDHIRRKTLKLDKVTNIVLDEADEMFAMGFREDMALVMDQLKEERQTVFFSATMEKEIMKFASLYQKDPKIIKVVPKELTVPKVEQTYLELKPNMKTEVLCRLIDIYNPKLSVVFCNTKRKVDELTTDLQSRGYFADGLHGDLKQSQRDNVMNKFRKGTIDILIATDVAARGIDVDDVDAVFNYDLPQDEEYYVHRIGRTARAGREGRAFNFVVGREMYKLRDIQKYTKTKIKRQDLPTLRDMEANYITNLIEDVRLEIEKKSLGKYEKIIETMTEEGQTSFDIAAAILKLYMNKDKMDLNNKKDIIEAPSGRTRSSKGKSSSKNQARVHINTGKRKGISQRHLLSAIIQETGLSKDEVGNIDIYDKFSFVEVPNNKLNLVVDKLDGVRVRGHKINVEPAKPKKK